MPRRASAAASNVITIGFIGVGAVDEGAVVDLIADWIEARAKNEEEINLIIPITEGNFTATLGFIAGFAKNNDLSYEAVIEVAPSTAPKSIKTYISDAAKTHKVEDTEAKVVDILKTAPGAALFVLFDSEEGADESFENAISELAMDAIEADVPAFDLTDALTQLQAAEGDADGEGAEGGDEEEAEQEQTEEEAGDDDGFEDLLKAVTDATASAIKEAFESFSSNGNGKVEPEAPAPRRGRRAASAEAETPAPRRARKAEATEEPAPRRSPGRPRKDGTPAQPRVANPKGRLVRSSG